MSCVTTYNGSPTQDPPAFTPQPQGVNAFYRAASMQATQPRYSHAQNVRSLRLSFKRVNCDKTIETFAHIFMP